MTSPLAAIEFIIRHDAYLHKSGERFDYLASIEERGAGCGAFRCATMREIRELAAELCAVRIRAAGGEDAEMLRALLERAPARARGRGASLTFQNVGIKQVSDKIWLVTFMHWDLGFFGHETRWIEPVDNPFEPKLLPMSPVSTATYVAGTDPNSLASRRR